MQRSLAECGVQNECDREDPFGKIVTRNQIDPTKKIKKIIIIIIIITNCN